MTIKELSIASDRGDSVNCVLCDQVAASEPKKCPTATDAATQRRACGIRAGVLTQLFRLKGRILSNIRCGQQPDAPGGDSSIGFVARAIGTQTLFRVAADINLEFFYPPVKEQSICFGISPEDKKDK